MSMQVLIFKLILDLPKKINTLCLRYFFLEISDCMLV